MEGVAGPDGNGLIQLNVAAVERKAAAGLSPTIHARIEREDLAGDVIEPSQKRDKPRRVVDRVEATEDVLGPHVGEARRGEIRRHARFEEAGEHDVATDVARAVFLGEALPEADQPRLGRGVGALPLGAATRRPRADHDDVAAPLPQHGFERRARAEKRPAQVGVEDFGEGARGEGGHDAVAGEAGVDDEDIDPFERGEEGLDRRFVAHIHFLAARSVDVIALEREFLPQGPGEPAFATGNDDMELRGRIGMHGAILGRQGGVLQIDLARWCRGF